MLAPVDGTPMVRRSVQSLLDAGVTRCVVVVSTLTAPTISDALAGLSVSLVINPEPDRGMFSSVRCGLQAVEADAYAAVLPGDMPFVQPATIAAVIECATNRGRTTTPSLHGNPGHPVVLAPEACARIAAAPIDSRLDVELAHEDIDRLEVDDPGIRMDFDRPGT